MTSSYLDMLQKGLVKAQESVMNYQEKVSAHTKIPHPESEPTPPETPPTS
jgi:hypothetical protein